MIDRKIAKCIRRVDPVSGRIEFHLPSGGLAFATYENEPVVMQLGTGMTISKATMTWIIPMRSVCGC
jgi:hypothetical protein